MGLAEAVVESVSACEPAAQPWLYRYLKLSPHNQIITLQLVTVSRLLPDLQKHFAHRRQHGLPWYGGEA